jgi:Flp pilus assembly protein TadG
MAGLRQLRRWCGRLRSARRLWADERGSILIYFTIVMGVMFGLIGLALDGGRYLMVNNDLQQVADAAALAAASQLDGESDALARADAAARNLDNDVHWYDVAGPKILAGTAGVQFYETLADVDANTPTSDAKKANFAKVTTGSWQVAPTFLVAVGALSNNSTEATAVAGSTYVACNVQPLMLCNPKFPSEFSATAGDLFGFTVNGSAPSSPGNFNLLDPGGETQSSAGDIRNLLSQSNPNFCYVDSVSPRPGAIAQNVAQGVNARFDVKPNGGGANMTGMDWTPDLNVVKGNTDNECFASVSTGNSPLDPAAELPGATGFTDSGGGSIYSSTVDTAGQASYMAAHHASAGTWPSGWTRYQMYQHEVDGSIAFDGTSNETMAKAPTCNGVTAAADRRIVSVAIIDCDPANPITGNKYKFLESRKYADFFLTRPVGPDNIIWAEFVRFMTPTSDGTKLHHIVQLYR